jgi:hypothetical protein
VEEHEDQIFLSEYEDVEEDSQWEFAECERDVLQEWTRQVPVAMPPKPKV